MTILTLVDLTLKYLVEHPGSINLSVLPKDLVTKLLEALRDPYYFEEKSLVRIAYRVPFLSVRSESIYMNFTEFLYLHDRTNVNLKKEVASENTIYTSTQGNQLTLFGDVIDGNFMYTRNFDVSLHISSDYLPLTLQHRACLDIRYLIDDTTLQSIPREHLDQAVQENLLSPPIGIPKRFLLPYQVEEDFTRY